MEPTEFIPYIYKSTPIFMNESFKKMKTIDQYCVIIIEQVNNAKSFYFRPTLWWRHVSVGAAILLHFLGCMLNNSTAALNMVIGLSASPNPEAMSPLTF